MLKKTILLTGFVVLLLFKTFASVSSPSPRCISVSQYGDVIFSWSVPADPGNEFNAYLIYSSPNSSGPFTLLDSIFIYSQTSYIHVGSNANTAPVYYYIETRYMYSGLVYAPALDTVSSVYLNLSNPGNGIALLSWNPIATPAISSSSGQYKIYLEHPLGSWTLRGTTSGLNFIDSAFVCSDTINYKVEITDTTLCVSTSSISGANFQNNIVPIPLFDTLSVDDNNHVIMSWNINPSVDVTGYIIYRFNSGAWLPIDTVFGINNTSYTDLTSRPDLSVEKYRLAAIDTCGNTSAMTTTFYSTISLVPTANICDRSVLLIWTAYSTIGTGLAGYGIYQATAGLAGPYTFLDTVGPNILTFIAGGLAPSTTYYYKIQAFDNSGTKTVTSNRIQFYSAIPIPPQFSYLRNVSVTAPDRVDISCHIDLASSTKKYKIMRSNDTAATNFTLIGTVIAGTTTPLLYSDTKAETSKNSYYYKIINVDSCGFDGIETNLGRTILLTAKSNSDLTNTLIWNDYGNWSGGIFSYNIYRGIDGVIDPFPIANVQFSNSGTNFYYDDISMLTQGEGVFNYYIEALENSGNIYGFNEASLSNIADAYQDPEVFLPNAFRPESFNNTFLPVTTYVHFADYQLMIFNRWGIKVFSTTSIDEGWDGKQGNKKCDGGVYVYLLQYKTSKGEHIERKGSVTLLR